MTMCHSRHHHRRAVSRPAEHAEPRDPALRASDADRESTVAQLREHGAAGRLDVDELEQRIGAAYAARTHGELAALLADLPAKRATGAVAPRRPHDWTPFLQVSALLGDLPVNVHTRAVAPRHGHDWAPFLQVSVLLIAIWAVSGAGYFWPAWVIVWWGFALVMKSGPRLLKLR